MEPESKTGLSPIEEIAFGESAASSVEIVPGNPTISTGHTTTSMNESVAMPSNGAPPLSGAASDALSGVLDKVVESNTAIASLISTIATSGPPSAPVYIAGAQSATRTVLSEKDALAVIEGQLKNAVSEPLDWRESLLRLARLAYICLISGTTLKIEVLRSVNHTAAYVADDPESELQDIVDRTVLEGERASRDEQDSNLLPDDAGVPGNYDIENLPMDVDPMYSNDAEHESVATPPPSPRGSPGLEISAIDNDITEVGSVEERLEDSDATTDAVDVADHEYPAPGTPVGDAEPVSDDSDSSHVQFVEQRFASSDLAAAPEAVPRSRDRGAPVNSGGRRNPPATPSNPPGRPSQTPSVRPPVIHALLTTGDGSKWDIRAKERAEFWTKRLTEARDAGRIGDDEWDGEPITAKQWNERTGSAYLREIFTRDRNNVYQAHRREAIKGNVAGDGKFDPFASQRRTSSTETLTADDTQPAAPTTRKRKGRAITLRRMRALPSRIDERTVVIPAINGMDADVELRDILDSMDPHKTFRVGKGLLDNSIHRRIMGSRRKLEPNPGPRAPVGKQAKTDKTSVASQVAIIEAESCARAALEVLLFFVNPEHGDGVIQGSSDLVYELAFVDIFNLLRLQPELIPPNHQDKFVDSPSTVDMSTIKRWNSKSGATGKFADVGRRVSREAQQGDDFFKVVYLVINSLIQLVSKEIDPMSADPSDISNSEHLLEAVLGMDENERTRLIASIMTTLHENIDSFLQQARRRLTLRRDV